MATQARGTMVTMIHQCSERFASTPAACTTEAMGRTMAAEISPCTAPDRTLEMATSQIGQGACTRSSISRVKPNSWAICMATAWMPWNMIEMPTTPGTRTVANADSAPGAAPAADALADLGEDVEEDEAEEERLDQGPGDELPEVLSEHHQVAQDERLQGDAAGGQRRTGRCRLDAGVGRGLEDGGHQSRRSLCISRVAPCR